MGQQAGGEDLEGDDAAEADVNGLVDRADAARGDVRLHLVFANAGGRRQVVRRHEALLRGDWAGRRKNDDETPRSPGCVVERVGTPRFVYHTRFQQEWFEKSRRTRVVSGGSADGPPVSCGTPTSYRTYQVRRTRTAASIGRRSGAAFHLTSCKCKPKPSPARRHIGCIQPGEAAIIDAHVIRRPKPRAGRRRPVRLRSDPRSLIVTARDGPSPERISPSQPRKSTGIRSTPTSAAAGTRPTRPMT